MKKHVSCLNLHGFPVIDAVFTFTERYNNLLKNRWYREFYINHGYGSSGAGGIIGRHIRLVMDEAGIIYIPGEDYNNNFGLTVVKLLDSKPVKFSLITDFVEKHYIRPYTPKRVHRLMPSIVRYCEYRKNKERIINRFHLDYMVVSEIEPALCYLTLSRKLICSISGPVESYVTNPILHL